MQSEVTGVIEHVRESNVNISFHWGLEKSIREINLFSDPTLLQSCDHQHLNGGPTSNWSISFKRVNVNLHITTDTKPSLDLP